MRCCAAIVLLLFRALNAAATPIVFWYSPDASQGAFLQETIAVFNRSHRRDPIQLETGFELQSALLALTPLRRLPEVILAPSNFIGLRDTLELSEVPGSAVSPGSDPRLRPLVEEDGKYWGVPLLGGNQIVLFYNRRLVEHPASRWEDLRAQATDLHRRGIKPIGWNYEEPYFFLPFLTAFGGWPVEGSQARLNTPAMAQALHFYRALGSDGLVPVTCGHDCSKEKFFAGKFAYALAGDWSYHDARAAMGESLGVAPLPNIDGRPMVSGRAAQALLFPHHSLSGKHRQVLLELARYLQTAPLQRRWANANDRLPAVVSAAKSWEAGDRARKVLLAEWKRSRDVPGVPVMTYVWPALRRGLREAIAGHVTEDQLMSEMQAVVDRGGRR